MSLAPGSRVGPYEVISRLGAGGMGEVYVARDGRLGRDVALKTLPEAFARDPERRARLEREARLLASLNHPNVASLFGIEEVQGTPVLVMELVPGATLAERLERGALPVLEALEVARQVAEGLEAAHRRGIIHRDLKPANVKLTTDGRIKVLDFGLAKALGASQTGDPQKAETASCGDTGSGVVLGTTAYMSPEQARGEELDERTDVWAFGCLLFECLTGRKAFAGATSSDTLAAVLEHEPDWSVLPAATPALVRSLLRLCLQKDRARRLQSITDARLEIEDALTASEAGGVPLERSAPQRSYWVVAAPLLMAVGLAGLWAMRPSPDVPRPVTRLAIRLPPGASVDLRTNYSASVAFAPDGSRLAYVVRQGDRSQIHVRGRDQLESVPLPGTDGGHNPFFSPDGRWLGFGAKGWLRKVPLDGGRPVELCRATQLRGGAWGPDGTIVFTPSTGTGLHRVPAAGGSCEALTSLDLDRNENSHRFPQFLPGGELVLFTVITRDLASFDEARIEVASLQNGRRRLVLEGGKHARYLPAGQLLYGRGGSLFAVPFDLRRLEVVGSRTEVVKSVAVSVNSGEVHFAVSNDGSLAYVPADLYGLEGARLFSVDRRGSARPLSPDRGLVHQVALSPDGQRIAANLEDVIDQIWVHDLGRGTWTRLTSGPDSNSPAWTPDGRRITFRRREPDGMKLYWQAADGSGAPERLSKEIAADEQPSWLPDGRGLAFGRQAPQSRTDIWLLRVDGSEKAEPLLSEPFNERDPQFSPDGRWLAYVADESGRSEVYVRPFPELRPKWQISSGGGFHPRWARNGRELFYFDHLKLMAVSLTTTPALRLGAPTLLFSGTYDHFDVAPDGQRFVMAEVAVQPSASEVHVVHNWSDEFVRRARAK